jgi:predicted transcriptional regulator
MSRRLVISLEPTTAARLTRLAKRSGADESKLAEMLLADAIDAADVSPATVTQLLDSTEAAFDRAKLGLRQARSGQTIRLDEL